MKIRFSKKILNAILFFGLLFVFQGVIIGQANDPLVHCVPSILIDPTCDDWFPTIQEANDDTSTISGDIILVGPGDQSGAFVSKAVEIIGLDGAVISTGPMHPAGLSMGFRLVAGSDGAEISHLDFTVDLAIMNGNAVDDVSVLHNRFFDTIQAVSNWRGNGWNISHNVIEDLRTLCGGGIGILVADFSGGTVQNNVVSHNKISGTLHVSDGDCGGYAGSGIVLYADFRWGGSGASEISNNYVTKNKVSLTSDDASLVRVFAFELTDTRDNGSISPVVFDNYIGFNDFRGSDNQIALTPDNLDESNTFSRNLGDNRGQGLSPGLFKP